MGFDIVFFYDGVWNLLLAGPERFELPTAGFEDQNSSAELRTDVIFYNSMEVNTIIIFVPKQTTIILQQVFIEM
jgi:hypothetical protein